MTDNLWTQQTLLRDLLAASSLGTAGARALRDRVDSSRAERIVRHADSGLDARYTFDTFTIGASNRFSHAAAVTVAECPGRAYNPVLIWGGPGLGKTHLLHAVGHHALLASPEIRVRYLRAGDLTMDILAALFGAVDVLLVDDLHVLGDLPTLQAPFADTMESLCDAGVQIVLTADAPPNRLAALDERLRTVIPRGLVVDVQPPDVATRVAILRAAARRAGVNLPDNVIELAFSRIERNKLGESGLELTAAHIVAAIAAYFGTDPETLRSPMQSPNLARARQIAMYLCREMTDLSLPKIGQAVGRTHAHAMYAHRKIANEMTASGETRDQITDLTLTIHARQAENRAGQ